MTSLSISRFRGQITQFFSWVIIGLFLATIGIVVLKINFSFLISNPVFSTIEAFLHFNGEANFVAWFSSLALLISSVLLAIIAYSKKQSGDRFYRHWKWLAIIFLIMAIDETAQIHESLAFILSRYLPGDRWFFEAKNAWFLIGIPVVLIFAYAFLKFLLHLPKKTKQLFFVAALIFVTGALGLEVASNYLQNLHTHYFWFRMAQSMEEICELFGIVLFNYALLLYLEKDLGYKHLTFDT
ncbi:hypothetical protein JW752_03960 [Candidatus Peregrinibacteria bacterium]|nr:hypothetical protein [Candidatus Peregrinibacteria bacterium]